MVVKIYRDEVGALAADVPPPYEVVGKYLGSDVQASASATQYILEKIKSVQEEKEAYWEMRGNAYSLTLTPESAFIKSDFSEPEEDCEIPLQYFQDILRQWLIFIENSKSDNDGNDEPYGYPIIE